MYNLKDYNNYITYKNDIMIKESEITSVVDTDIDDLISELEKMAELKVSTSSLKEYYKEYTKDGEKIDTSKNYYIYAKYVGNEKVSKKNQTFVIKFNEITDSGYTYDILESLTEPDLKNIEKGNIEFPGKNSEIYRNYISGRFVVSDKNKMDLLKDGVVVDEKGKDDKKEKQLTVKGKIVKGKATISKEVEQLRELSKNLSKIDKTNLIKRINDKINKIQQEINKLKEIEQESGIVNEINKNKNNVQLLQGLIDELKN